MIMWLQAFEWCCRLYIKLHYIVNCIDQKFKMCFESELSRVLNVHRDRLFTKLAYITCITGVCVAMFGNLYVTCDHVSSLYITTLAYIINRLAALYAIYLLDLYKQDAMYRELKSTPNLDYVKYLNRTQLLDLLEDEETIRATVRVNSKVTFKGKIQHLDRIS